MIAHVARAEDYWNLSRFWPERSAGDLDTRLRMKKEVGMGPGQGTGLKALTDLFLTHRHDWYGKDHGVYAVVVSAASDTEEGDNTIKPIQGATELVRRQLVEWQIPIREVTYRARASNDPLGPANATVLVKISHKAQEVWLNHDPVYVSSPR